MSDNAEQLVYEVKVSLGNSQRELEALKRNFGETSDLVKVLNSMPVRVIPDGETTNELQSLQQKLKEVQKAIELFRPGPIYGGYLQQFIDSKNGGSVEYPCEAMEEVVGRTYGVLVYQEQIMEIAMKMAGY